ncbi:MAG: hypothetical protein VXW11_04310 [Pseudomonadota bacterium]|nr:hypothetical protein [Pseudomonadota bacterium]
MRQLARGEFPVAGGVVVCSADLRPFSSSVMARLLFDKDLSNAYLQGMRA